MNSFIRQPSRGRDTNYMSGSDLVTKSLQRNWKASGSKIKSDSSLDIRCTSDNQRNLGIETESSSISDAEKEIKKERKHVRVAPRRSASLSRADDLGQIPDMPLRNRSPDARVETGRWRSLSPPISAALWTGTIDCTDVRPIIDSEWEEAENVYLNSASGKDSSHCHQATSSSGETDVTTLRRKKKRMDEMLVAEVKKFRERRKDIRTSTKEVQRKSSHGNIFYHTLETKKVVRESDYSQRSQSLDRQNTKQKHVNRIYLGNDVENQASGDRSYSRDLEKIPDYSWTKRDTFKHITKERFSIPRGMIIEVNHDHKVPSYATIFKSPKQQKPLENERNLEGIVTLPRKSKKTGEKDYITRINILKDNIDPRATVLKSNSLVENNQNDHSSIFAEKSQGSVIKVEGESGERLRVCSSSSSSTRNITPITKGGKRPPSADSSASKHHQSSDTASDIAIENERIKPEGDDYRLVFISSDSSKSSLEDSFEQETQDFSRQPSSLINESDNAGFIDESDWDFYVNERKASKSGMFTILKFIIIYSSFATKFNKEKGSKEMSKLNLWM
ncbi:uncharacterized protein LOC136029163 isoform X2 [Artemia franciscana]